MPSILETIHRNFSPDVSKPIGCMVVQDIFILAVVKISLINAHLDLTAVFHHSIDSLPEKSRFVIYIRFLCGALAHSLVPRPFISHPEKGSSETRIPFWFYAA